MSDGNTKENETSVFRDSFNADKSYKTSRDYLNKRLLDVDRVIRGSANELFYTRKFHLQNLYEDKEKID